MENKTEKITADELKEILGKFDEFIDEIIKGRKERKND